MRQIALLFSLAALAAGCTPTSPPPPPPPPLPAPTPGPAAAATPVPSFIADAPKQSGTTVATATTTVKMVDSTPVVHAAGADVTLQLKTNDPALAAAFAARAASEAQADAFKAQAVAAEQARQRALQVAAAKKTVREPLAAKHVKLEMQSP